MSKTITVRADARLQNLPQEALDELWSLRHPEVEGDKVWTLTDVAAWAPGRFGFEVSTSAVANFYQWLALKRRLDGAAARAEQARLELARDPNMTPEDVERVGQLVFTTEALESGNVKGYVALARLRLQSQAQQLEKEKLTAAAKSKIDAGLDALFAEIKGNARAEKLFAELKAAVAKA